MIDFETKERVAKYFGLTLLQTGKHKIRNQDKSISKIIEPSFIWLAEIPLLMGLTPMGARNLLVAVVKTAEWRRGLLLVPADRMLGLPDREYIGGDELAPVDLSIDPYEETLGSVDLTYAKLLPGIHESAHAIYLFVNTPVVRADMTLEVLHFDEDPNHSNLWFSLKSVILNLLDQYDRKDMKTFFERLVW